MVFVIVRRRRMCGNSENFIECRNQDAGFYMCSERVFVERVVEDTARYKPNSQASRYPTN